MYQTKKKNTLVNIIRANQTYHGVTELTVFENTDFGDLNVCYSGSLDDFNAVGKLDIGLQQYRYQLLKRLVQQKLVFHEKLFVWLENDVAITRGNMKENLYKLISLLQEGRNKYQKAHQIENNIFELLEKIGIYDPDGVPISVPESSNLSDAISYQLHESNDYIGTIIETVAKYISKSENVSS